MKKLPKAVTRTADEMRRAAPVPELILSRGEPAVEIRRPVRQSEQGFSLASRASSALPLQADVSANDIDRAWRAHLAHAIVQRHAAYSAIGGMVPLPIVNVAGITAVIVRMVKSLSEHYDVPFERDRARSIVIGLAMGVFPTGLGAVTSSSLMAFVPGANAIGLVASSVTAAACTQSIGRLFIEHFENGSTLADFPLLDSRSPH
jgi:uncharacterized protein (DUF697 family)